jgi:hypothetical protein
MKETAALVPKIIKALMKLSSDRKANLAKIQTADEKEILTAATEFLKERFKAEVSVFGENDMERYDPKNRAAMALPNQPAIYIE